MTLTALLRRGAYLAPHPQSVTWLFNAVRPGPVRELQQMPEMVYRSTPGVVIADFLATGSIHLVGNSIELTRSAKSAFYGKFLRILGFFKKFYKI